MRLCAGIREFRTASIARSLSFSRPSLCSPRTTLSPKSSSLQRTLLSSSSASPAASSSLSTSLSSASASASASSSTAAAAAAAAASVSAPEEMQEPAYAAAFPEVPRLDALRQLAGPPVVPHRLAHATERLFLDEKDGDSGGGSSGTVPELLLYRDNSSWCPYCERVWLQLEEKRIPYRIEKINMRCYGPKPAWFTRIVPSGLLPVIKLNDKIVTESLDIMLLIEETFPTYNPLLPSDPASRKHCQQLLRLERQLASAWLQWAGAPPPQKSRGRGGGSSGGGWWPGGGGGAFPDPGERFENVMVEVDKALSLQGGPFFLGPKFSMIDAVFAPFIERIAASVPFWKGLQVRNNPKWPNVNAWMDAMDAWPTYKAIKSDDFTITHTLEPQIGPVTNLPEGAAYRALIEGKDGGWELPLKPEDTAWGHDDGTGAGGAKEEAAQALVLNHEAIVGFAMRSMNKKPADAPEQAAHVSAGLRHVAHALIKGFDKVGPPPSGLDVQTTARAAAYLRDKIGVPRDLTYPAARQLRAHLQWLIRSLGSDL